MTSGKRPGDVAAAVERHGRDLQKVNDRLKDLISSLQSERARIDHARAAPAAAPAATTPLRPVSPAPLPTSPAPAPEENERLRLAIELAEAREALGRAADQRQHLAARLVELEAENTRLCDEFVAAEEQTTALVERYASLERIHGAPGTEDLLQALEEIVISVVGSEEFAVLELRDGALRVMRAFGLPAGALDGARLGEGTLGRAVATGTRWVAGQGAPAEDDRLSAVVPLQAAGRTVGAIAVFRLLGHKPFFGPDDHAVFDLLAEHAGAALELRRSRGS